MNYISQNLNTELFASLEVISKNENKMRKAVDYLKKLAKTGDEESVKMAKEDFFNMLDEAEKGESMTFENVDQLDRQIRGL